MRDYQYISILKIFLLYIVALLPTWIILLQKNTYIDKKTFIKRNSLLIFLEIIIFSVIYIFPKEIVMLFSSKTNVQNYMMYSLKILFIASSLSVVHYSIPLYFIFKYQKAGIFLWIFKLLFIPVILISYFTFNTKGALFAVPLCDILYSLFLILKIKQKSHI